MSMQTIDAGNNTHVIRIQSVVRGWLSRRRCGPLAQVIVEQSTSQSFGLEEPPADRPPDPVALDPGNHAYLESELFHELCTEDKRRLFETQRKVVMRSVRRWEQRQLREKTIARANRLARMKSDNGEQLTGLQQGATTYNLRSIRQAAIHGDIGRLLELLNLGFYVDAPSAMGLTPLLGACQSGCLATVRVLLQHGANVNLQHIKTKRTPLMEASSRENLDIVRELLRYGALLYTRDAHGETAFDCAKDSGIHHDLLLAASIWSQENATLFPAPFRSAGRTFLLIRHRQDVQSFERRAAIRREISELCPAFLRSAVEAKVRFDEAVRLSHSQVTILGKVDQLRRADERFDCDRAQLLQSIERVLLSKAEGERPRALPRTAIHTILAFCDRHWFDRRCEKHRQKQTRDHHRTRSPPVEPKRRRTGVRVVPQMIAAEWIDLKCALEARCEELRRAQAEERPDAENGVTRDNNGQTLSVLHVRVLEAQYLPFRDPRVHEPIDPYVRLALRDRLAEFTTSSTEIRLSDRHPIWNTDFDFRVESVTSDLVLHLVDAKRQEVAGEITVGLRTLLDQKWHDEWFLLPPTLRQQALEKSPREQPARVHLALRLVHTQSLVLSREIQRLLAVRTDMLRRKFALMQSELDRLIEQLRKPNP